MPSRAAPRPPGPPFSAMAHSYRSSRTSPQWRTPCGALLAVLLTVLSGCEAVDMITGKDRLERDLHRAQDDSRARLIEREERIRLLEEETIALQERLGTALTELETLRAERSAAAISVLLFRGDITYAVTPAAFSDYRAGLRLHALNDAAFGEALEKFEKLEGGDATVFLVLRKIDSSDDRLIGLEEARAFRRVQEAAFNPKAE